MKQKTNERVSIEEEFVELDRNNHLANVSLHYENPSEIINDTVVTGTPMLKQEFVEYVLNVFDVIPDAYRLNIHVLFDRFDEFNEETLKNIFRKNVLLEGKIQKEKVRKQNRLAGSLCLLGLLFVLLSIIVNVYWKEETTFKEIALFVLDIAATVPFWSAADTYIVL